MFHSIIKRNILLNKYFSIGYYTIPILPRYYHVAQQQVIHYRNIINTAALLTGRGSVFYSGKTAGRKKPF
jgi:hypothetical protein